jgi:hypothetical protein
MFASYFEDNRPRNNTAIFHAWRFRSGQVAFCMKTLMIKICKNLMTKFEHACNEIC